MEITIQGCRGSYPVAYPEILRYGGDTTCLEVVSDDALLVLDAGTGIRKINTIPENIREVHLFITHLHWDHIIGFPQWPLLHSHPDLSFHLYGLERTHDHFYAALEQSISTPLYPRSLEDMLVGFHFHELLPGDRMDVGNTLHVQTALANHPYRALGYRIESQQGTLAFIPDTAPFDRYLFDDEIVLKDTSLTGFEREKLVERQDQIVILAGDADWLIYDAALTPPEYEMLPHWGHSTMDQACDIARQAGAKELVLFHHGPTRTDDMVDNMLANQIKQNPDMNLSAAYAGMQLTKLSAKEER